MVCGPDGLVAALKAAGGVVLNVDAAPGKDAGVSVRCAVGGVAAGRVQVRGRPVARQPAARAQGSVRRHLAIRSVVKVRGSGWDGREGRADRSIALAEPLSS